MNNNELDTLLYNKYISKTKKKRERFAGVEIEMPVVNLNDRPVDEQVCIAVAKQFSEQFGFQPISFDSDGNANSYDHSETADNLSFDCSYSNLELSLGKRENIYEIKTQFEQYYAALNHLFAEYNYTLTGMGVNPSYNINHNQPVKNERYRMLYHYLHTYPRYEGKTEQAFHHRPDFGTFTSASQVQLDVDYNDLAATVNTVEALEPYKALLFANSYMNEYPDLMCTRNMLWEHSMQGYNPHNIGMFDRHFHTTDEIVEYIKTMSLYCTMRDGRYIDFTPIPVNEYFNHDTVTGEYFDGTEYQKVIFSPQPEDLDYLRSFKFEDITFRGTIEYRSACCQPVHDSMTVAAFHCGVAEKLYEIKDYLETKDHLIVHCGYTPAELQKLFSKRDLPSFVDKALLRQDLTAVLDIIGEGLKSRDFGEEKLLEPLYDRANRLTNPAKEMVEGIEKGKTLKDYILAYSKL